MDVQSTGKSPELPKNQRCLSEDSNEDHWTTVRVV